MVRFLRAFPRACNAQARATRRRGMQAFAVLAAVGTMTVLAACGSDDDGSAEQTAGGAETVTINMGFLNDFAAANAWTMEECLAPKNVKLNMEPFTQWADVQRAFQSGQVDLGVMGYQNLAQMLDADYSDFKIVAGVNNGDTYVTEGDAVQLSSWKDVEGKKVGIPPNSFSDMLFRTVAAENGADVSKVEFVNFPGAGPAMLSALESGAIDVMVAWEANGATAKVQGIGDYSSLNLSGGPLGKPNSVLYATDSLIQEQRDAVQAVVDCLVERTRDLSDNPDEWISIAMSKTGLTQDVAAEAIKHVTMDVKLYPEAAAHLIQEFSKLGLVADESDRVAEQIDYSFLEKATGMSEAELNAG